MKYSKQIIRAVDLVLAFGSMFVVLWAIGFSNPQVIAPADNFETTGSTILFSIENADKLVIGTDLNFMDGKEYDLNENLSLDLLPGLYYWKVVGVLESEIRTLTIKDAVVLNIVKGDDGYDVINAGTVNLNIEVYNNKSEFVENVTLVPNEGIAVDKSKYIGGQNE